MLTFPPPTPSSQSPARTAGAPPAAKKPKADQHYKIKMSGFRFSPDDPFDITLAVEHIDREALRLANYMYAQGKGKSKHEYKLGHKGKPDKTVAYAQSTARNMYKTLHTFIVWAFKNKKIRPGMRLRDLIPTIQPYLDEKAKCCTPNTVHTYATYLCKAYFLEMSEYRYPMRRRADVVLHRKSEEYFFEMLAIYPELVRFCLSTGLRKYKELARLTGTALCRRSGTSMLYVEGKGGYRHYVPVVGGKGGEELVMRLCRRAGKGLVFPKLPKELDVHMLRAMYASAIYLRNARDIRLLSRKEKYYCRTDYQGIVLDRRAMEIVSKGSVTSGSASSHRATSGPSRTISAAGRCPHLCGCFSTEASAFDAL